MEVMLSLLNAPVFPATTTSLSAQENTERQLDVGLLFVGDRLYEEMMVLMKMA